MRSSVPLSALLLCAGVLTIPVRAETADPRDVATIEACLRRSEATDPLGDTCIGVVAKPCFNNDEGSVASGQVTQCFGREHLVWDQLVNDAYKHLRDHLDDQQQIKLRDMQRSWIATLKATCDFYDDYFQGSMAYPMMESCQNRETARRALFLRVFDSDVQNRK